MMQGGGKNNGLYHNRMPGGAPNPNPLDMDGQGNVMGSY
jgi:hypothetical protein